MADVVVLVSAGRHPVSGRPRRAELDARAVELALRLPSAAVTLLHVGETAEPSLRDYAGMGPGEVIVLPPASGVLATLATYLRAHPPALVLAGLHGEAGEDGGILPYALAEALGWPLVAAAVALEEQAPGWRVDQGLPRGVRRRLTTMGPAVVTVASGAPVARPFAYARALRADIVAAPALALPAVARAASEWTERPARRRPKRLDAPDQAGPGGGARALLQSASPEEAAEAIWGFLLRHGIVKGRP